MLPCSGQESSPGETSRTEQGTYQGLPVRMELHPWIRATCAGKNTSGEVEREFRSRHFARHTSQVVRYPILRRVGGAVCNALQFWKLRCHLCEVLERNRLPQEQTPVSSLAQQVVHHQQTDVMDFPFWQKQGEHVIVICSIYWRELIN